MNTRSCILDYFISIIYLLSVNMRILVDWDLRCVDVWTRNESKHNVSAWHHQNQLQVPQEARI